MLEWIVMGCTTLALAFLAKKALGWLIGRLILSAQRHPKNLTIPANSFSVPIKNGELNTLEIKPELAFQKGPDNGHYIVCFCDKGRPYTHKTKMEDAQALANQNQATVVAFDYPNVGKSTGSVYSQSDLIKAGIAQVNRLLKNGVPARKITLYGHSLGGAIATKVADHYHGRKQTVSLINDRSFSTIGDTVASWVKGPVWLKKMIKAIANPVCRLFNWNLDAASAYKRIPEQYKMHIVSKVDHMIHYNGASLHKKNCSHLRTYKTYSYKIGGEHNGHNKPLHVLKDNKTPATSINTHIASFIARPR